MQPGHFLPKSRRLERTRLVVERARGRSLLHIGCTGGELDSAGLRGYSRSSAFAHNLHRKLATVARELTGADISARKIAAMRAAGIPGRLVVSDVTEPDFAARFEPGFDVIIFGECIEHLDNPSGSLDNCRRLMGEESELVITTVNAYAFPAILKMLAGYESVHDEHTAYYSYFTLKRLLEMNGLELSEFYFTWDRRSAFGGAIDRWTHTLGNAVAGVLPQFSQGIAAVARLAGERASRSVRVSPAPRSVASQSRGIRPIPIS